MVGPSSSWGKSFRPFAYAWDLEKDESPSILKASASILALAHSDSDQSILAVSNDGILHRWSSKDHQLQSTIALKFSAEPHPVDPSFREAVTVTAATFIAGGAKLALVARRGGLRIIEVGTGKETGRGGAADFVVASPVARLLAVTNSSTQDAYKRLGNENEHLELASTSATISLVDADTCRERLKINVAGSAVWSMAFSPDGKTLAATSGWETGQIHLYRSRHWT